VVVGFSDCFFFALLFAGGAAPLSARTGAERGDSSDSDCCGTGTESRALIFERMPRSPRQSGLNPQCQESRFLDSVGGMHLITACPCTRRLATA